MDFKAYLSSLFYLTEALKYLSPEQKLITLNQVVSLCRTGFTETQVFGFKVYQEFYTRWPNMAWFTKNHLNKSKGTFWLQDREILNPQEKPRVFNGQRPENGYYEFETELNLVNGPALVRVSYNEDQDDEDGYSADWSLRLTFTNYRNYNEADLRLLMDQLVDFLPNRE
jgi:hypothetical protein